MWFFNKKKQLSENHHILTEEDRQQSAEIRRINKETKLTLAQIKLEEAKTDLELKKMELQMKMEEFDDDDDDDNSPNLESLLFGIISPIIQNKLNSHIGTTSPFVSENSSSSGEVVLSSEQITDLWNKLPKNIQVEAIKSNDDDIKLFIKKNIPNISEKSSNDILEYIRKQKV